MAWAPFAAMAASKIFDKLWGGQNQKMQKVPTMDKTQQALYKQMAQMLQGGLGQGMQQGIQHQMNLMNPNSEAVNQFVQPYMDQFNQQTVPGLAERFAGMGAMGGGLSSSGFGQSLSSAGSALQNQLAALKAGLGQQAAQSLMSQYGNMSGQILGAQPFGYMQPGMTGGQGFLQGYGNAGFPGMQGGWNTMQDWLVNNTPGGV